MDPIVTASAIVMNLQTIVSRTVSPLEAGVVSITQFDAGSGAFNVIPQTATLRGTIRSLNTDTLLKLRDRVAHIVEGTARTHGCNATIQYSPDLYPVTTNDPVLFQEFSQHVGALVAEDGVLTDVEPNSTKRIDAKLYVYNIFRHEYSRQSPMFPIDVAVLVPFCLLCERYAVY